MQGTPGGSWVAPVSCSIRSSRAAWQPGEILVAPETDPGWLPLFVAAAGVVVDTGSQVSHAIVVSRELGMPCVIRAADATKRIPDGMLIEVDGTNGRVTAVAST